ncbi:MAG: DUF4236 domain-containing protein [Paramuribaculum sp.]|nr:DUF4236 domain-containing protein [Paramuribaculum sp.]
MAIYLRKRVRLFKGINVNFSKSGPSLSVGPRGAKLNISKRGIYAYASIPGTGIYMRQKINGRGKSPSTRLINSANTVPTIPRKCPIAKLVGVIFLVTPMLIYMFTPLPWWSLLIVYVLSVVLGLIATEVIAKIEDPDWVPGQPLIQEEVIEEDCRKLDEACSIENNMGITPSETPKSIIHYADPLFVDAAHLAVENGRISTANVQRAFSIGYPRAKTIIDQLTEAKIISQAMPDLLHNILVSSENLDDCLKLLSLEYREETKDVLLEKRRELLFDRQKSAEEQEKLNRQAKLCELVPLASNEEKRGMIKEAILHYEEVVTAEIPVTLPYERLPIIYRKMKLYDDEIRVLETAIRAFSKENEYRATAAIKLGYIDFPTAMSALESNETVRDESGIVLLSLYDLNPYFNRLSKAKVLRDRNANNNQ